MSTSNVVKFRPQDFQEQLKDKIRAEIGNLIPEEQWQALVSDEINEFFENKQTPGGPFRHDEFRPAYFTKVCNEEIAAYCRAQVKKVLESPEWKPSWDAKGQQLASEMVKKIFVDEGTQLLNAMFEGLGQSVVDSIRNSMSQQTY